MKTIAVIPAYNEASVIADVVRRALSFADEVVVVDDGSSDRTGEIARTAGAQVYTHVINRGLGATLATGLAAGLKRGGDILVTLDADGQHDPAEIPNFVKVIQDRGVDAVIGSRLLHGEGMPLIRRLYNRFGNLFTYVLFGVWVTDSQSGFRAFTRHGAKQIDIRTNRMEVSSEIVKEIHDKKLAFCEIPCTVKYTEYSMSKGQSFTVGIATAIKLILRRLMG